MGMGVVPQEVGKMATVQYSACVTLYENTKVNIYTMLYEGQWQWFGSEMEIIGYNELGCKEYRWVRNIDCGGARYDSSAAAIAAAVAQFGGAPEDWGLAP